MNQTAQKRKRVSPDINKDAIMLCWLNTINKWYVVYNEPVSKTYWEYVYDRDIEFGVAFETPDFKTRTKFIRIGEPIN